MIKDDGIVKSRGIAPFVIPAEAGIQSFQSVTYCLGYGFQRREDFLRGHKRLRFAGPVHPAVPLRRMSMIVMAALLLFFTATAFSKAGTETAGRSPLSMDESRAILGRLSQMHADIRSFQADFIEERVIPEPAISLKFEGRIYYSNKGLFFMAYKKPVHHILKVKGNEALFFVEGSKTADLVDISAARGIAGKADIFTIDPSRFSGRVLEAQDGYILEENRKAVDKEGHGAGISVYLDKKSLLAKKILMRDESGDVTVIRLFNVKINREIPHPIRSFQLPEGVKINRLNQP